MFTANIRLNNRKNLIPTDNYNGFSNNSNVVGLSNSNRLNGKWFIYGFSLNNINNLSGMLNNSILNFS